MGINETLRAHESLVEYNLPIGGALVNRITPEFEHEFLQKGREQELECIAELDEKLGMVNVGQLELADSEIVGVEPSTGRSPTLRPRAIAANDWPPRCWTGPPPRVHRGMVADSKRTTSEPVAFPGLSVATCPCAMKTACSLWA